MTSAETLALAIKHQNAGNLGQAETLYRQVLDADPRNPSARYRLAMVCHLQGRAAEAVVLYQQLLHNQPDSAMLHNNLGLAHASLSRFDEATASYREALRLQPAFAEAFNNLGNVHSARGEGDQALTAFRQALALKPNYPAAWNNLGRLHFDQGRWDEAAPCFQKALALHPENPVALNNLGLVWFNLGKFADAGSCYRQILRSYPNVAEVHFNLARVHRALQQWPAAAACLHKSLTCNPHSAEALDALGDIYRQLGKFAEALDCYQRLLALRPEDANARMLVGALRGTSELSQVPADFVIATYESWAERFDQEVRQRGDFSPQALKAALGEGPPARSLTVLDLGCGTGLCGVEFREWAQTLIGVDLSANMLAKARQRNLYDELIHGDLLTPLQGRDSAFDLIVASDVLLYLGDLRPLMHAARRALRPGGRFAFTVDLLAEGTGYRQTPWIHFAHSRRYLQELAQETQLQEVFQREVIFPRTGGEQAKGMVVVFARNEPRAG